MSDLKCDEGRRDASSAHGGNKGPAREVLRRRPTGAPSSGPPLFRRRLSTVQASGISWRSNLPTAPVPRFEEPGAGPGNAPTVILLSLFISLLCPRAGRDVTCPATHVHAAPERPVPESGAGGPAARPCVAPPWRPARRPPPGRGRRPCGRTRPGRVRRADQGVRVGEAPDRPRSRRIPPKARRPRPTCPEELGHERPRAVLPDSAKLIPEKRGRPCACVPGGNGPPFGLP